MLHTALALEQTIHCYAFIALWHKMDISPPM